MSSPPGLPPWAEPPGSGPAAQPPAGLRKAFVALVAYVVVALVWGLVALVVTSAAVAEIPGRLGLSVEASALRLLLAALVYGIALYVAVRMRAGEHWARTTLGILAGIGVVLGVIGLTAGVGAFAVTAEIFGVVYPVLGLVVRVVEIALLGAALVWMFRTGVDTIFR